MEGGGGSHEVVEGAGHAAREGERVLKVEEEACREGGEGRAAHGVCELPQHPVLVNEDERNLSICLGLKNYCLIRGKIYE